jgi:hypothetical protein
LLGDASRDELDPDFAHIRALELFCVRAGVTVMSLSARGAVGIGDAISVHHPDLVVLAGGGLADDAVANWTRLVRHAPGAIPVVLYRRGTERMRMATAGTPTLPSGADDARQRVLELIEAQPAPARVPALSRAASM